MMRSHIEPFMSGTAAWLVVIRNAVPVLGVYLFDWSAYIVAFEYWFDCVATLGILCAVIMPGVVREVGTPFGDSFVSRLSFGFVGWLLGFLLLGIPLWFAFTILTVYPSIGKEIWSVLRVNPSVWIGLLGIAISNAFEILPRNYDSKPEAKIRRSLNWEFQLLLARAGALLMVVPFFFPLGMIAVLALGSSYIEIFPLRALKFLGAPVDESDVPHEDES